ncbi:AI-2E family transporter [Novimethylophilus kurashikiensis]|uniref:AI-2E family transporter n=1 Tax=Novimethylophilus kurashikiensis TaxID=1825523 RepID=UPI0011B24704|nr:permease [Novimethylophilus kurashikiensis]
MATLLLALSMHTIPALLSGLLAFALTRHLLGFLQRYPNMQLILGHEHLAGLLVGLGSFVVLAAIGMGVAHLLEGESLKGLMLTLAVTIKQSKHYLPLSVASQLPETVLELKERFSDSLREHAGTLADIGTHAMHTLVLTLIGWIAGVLAAVRKPCAEKLAPFTSTWLKLWQQLGIAFEHVAFAQCKIAGLNAALTGIFLLGICPLFGWHIPFAKSMVLVTFLCSLIPVVGNLVSNTAICTLALGVSLPAAAAALGFLVVVHKLEYFMNARIQGHEIGAQAWELLIMLFSFELLFGPIGMAAAPVFYAFVKNELRRHAWLTK